MTGDPNEMIVCKGCPYFAGCSSKATQDGNIGVIPNISLDDVNVLTTMLGVARAENPLVPYLPDLEDLEKVTSDSERMERLHVSHPSMLKRARRLLAISRKTGTGSPVIKAARSGTVQVSS